MLGGSRQKGTGISIATNWFTKRDCIFLANLIQRQFALKTSVISAGYPNQWKVTVLEGSMPSLRALVGPYFNVKYLYKIN